MGHTDLHHLLNWGNESLGHQLLTSFELWVYKLLLPTHTNCFPIQFFLSAYWGLLEFKFSPLRHILFTATKRCSAWLEYLKLFLLDLKTKKQKQKKTQTSQRHPLHEEDTSLLGTSKQRTLSFAGMKMGQIVVKDSVFILQSSTSWFLGYQERLGKASPTEIQPLIS